VKLLMLYVERFAWRTAQKALESAPEIDARETVADALVGLIHAEPGDAEDPGRVEKKLIKNLKWAARKNESRRIVLHSFSHLAEEKADPEFARELLEGARKRLQGAGYEALQTPFGYFLDLDIAAPGRSTARIFASF